MHMTQALSHQGGIRDGAQPITVRAAPPVYQNKRGGEASAAPPEVTVPRMRRVEAPDDFWLPQWAREIVDRNGSVEEMVREALNRLSHRHSEESLLEAQTIINELGRSGEHTELMRSILTVDTIRPLLRARR
jgi:hypothetical protein